MADTIALQHHFLEQIVNVHWKEKVAEEGCSSGGAVNIGVTHEFGSLFWDLKGQIGYCFQVNPGLDPPGVSFELKAALDPAIAGSTAWRIKTQYPNDPGAAAALSIASRLINPAVSYLDGLPGNVDGLAPFGPFGQGSEIFPTTCYGKVYPAAQPGTNPSGESWDGDICDPGPWKKRYSGPYDPSANGGTDFITSDPNLLYIASLKSGTTDYFLPGINGRASWVYYNGDYYQYAPTT